MKKCIVIANGRPPSKSQIRYLNRLGYKTIFCADGGADHAYRMGINPDFIIGDLDSVSDKVLRFFKSKSEIFRISRQTDTDVEKTLKHAFKLGYREAILMGVTGDRLDHTLCNLGIVLKFFSRIKCLIIAENSVLLPLTGHNEIRTQAGETISFYGFNKKTRISSRGLKYPLNRTALPFGEKESTSNVALKERVNINVEGGIVFMIRDFKYLKSNDLF